MTQELDVITTTTPPYFILITVRNSSPRFWIKFCQIVTRLFEDDYFYFPAPLFVRSSKDKTKGEMLEASVDRTRLVS
jgi:hypothetical protein